MLQGVPTRGGRPPFNRNQQTSDARGGFCGTCKACDGKNHHAKDCFFLQKLRMALCYLDGNPRYPQAMQQWRGRNNFWTNEAKVQTLIASNFIPYTTAPPEVFFEAINDHHDMFKPELERNK